MSFPLFLARRLRRDNLSGERHRSSAPAVMVATFGVAIGLAVMLVAVAVSKGFQGEVKNKIAGFASHIEILDMSSFQSPEDFPITAERSFIDQIERLKDVTHAQRVSQKMGIIKTNDHFTTIALNGVGEDFDATFMKNNIVQGEWPAFSDTVASNNIVLSVKLARELGLGVGSRVYAYFFEDVVKTRRLKVTGLYDTNLSQFDELFVFTDRYTVNSLNGWKQNQCSIIEIQTTDFDSHTNSIEPIRALLKQKALSGDEAPVVLSIRKDPRAQNTFGWIDLLDFDVLVVIVLMILVAGFTMISGLLILILERVQTIGILKALGASNAQLRHTFLWLSVMIIGRGMFWGNVLGLGLIVIQYYYAPLRLDPASYYVEQVPVLLTPLWWISINIGTLLLTFGALLLPSFAVSRVQPAKAIRFD